MTPKADRIAEVQEDSRTPILRRGDKKGEFQKGAVEKRVGITLKSLLNTPF